MAQRSRAGGGQAPRAGRRVAGVAVGRRDLDYVTDALDVARGAAFSVVVLLFSIVLIVVISIYMLLDMPRLERSVDARFPPHTGLPLTIRLEQALWGYVKGQAILSIVIGTSAGVGNVAARDARARRGRREVRAAVRGLDRVHRGDPVHRAVAVRGAADAVRARSSTRSRGRSRWLRCSSSSTRWRGTSSSRT